MKSKIFISLFILCVSIAFAQKPKKGDRQLVVGANLGSASLTYKKYTKDDLVLRYQLNTGFEYNRPTDVEDDGIKSEFKKSNSSIGLNIGVQKNLLLTSERFEPFIGFVLGLGYENMNSYSSTVYEDSIKYKISKREESYEKSTFRSDIYKINFGLVAGFNYYVAKNFALGAEISMGRLTLNRLTSLKTSEKYEYDYREKGFTKNNSLDAFFSDQINFSISPSVQVTASFWFK